ncbi:MAG: hypothetical protein LBL95_01760, partial [Deltaproteobacteria bacterium]|nr:hypothetical protein [Deltaproteobacteria bacterium]
MPGKEQPQRRTPNPGGPGDARSLRRIERLVRVGALIALCALVWYFSYDHGRSDGRNRVLKLERENISLREMLALAEADIRAVKESLAAAEAARCQPPGPDGEAPPASGGAGDQAPGPAEAPRPADDQARGRLTLRTMENKAAFGGQAILSLVELNSIDLEVTLRIRDAVSGRREAHVMVPGDLVEFGLDGQNHTLYLDQVRG